MEKILACEARAEVHLVLSKADFVAGCGSGNRICSSEVKYKFNHYLKSSEYTIIELKMLMSTSLTSCVSPFHGLTIHKFAEILISVCPYKLL